MSYYDSDWTYRTPISVDNTAGAGGAIDVSIVIPKDWDQFWDNVLSSGNDVRVCDADGHTLLTYDLDSFNTTTRAGTIEVDGYTAPAAGMLQLWLYWGNAAAADARTAFAPASAKSGYIEHGGAVGPRVVVTAERFGETKPRTQLVKSVSEVIRVTFDFSGLMQKQRAATSGSLEMEELDYVNIQCLLSAADQSSMYTKTSTRFAGGHLVICEFKAGTNATAYTMEVTALTTSPATTGQLGGIARTIIGRQHLKVQNVAET